MGLIGAPATKTEIIVEKKIDNNTGNVTVSNPVTTTASGSIYDEWDYNSSTQDEYQAQKKSAKDVAKDLYQSGMYDYRVTCDNAHKVEKSLINNDEWKVDIVTNPDAEGEDLNYDGIIDEKELVEARCEAVSLLEAIVDSYDSALDLYIEKQMQDIIETYGPNCNYNLRAIFGNPNSPAIKDLAKMGIRADAVGDHDNWQNRTYTFSLVDMTDTEGMSEEEILAHVYSDDAKILQDEKGNKGSIIFADCLTADGTAQGAEMNLSSILDQMGYDCVSKADYIGNKDAYDKLISDIDKGLKSNAFAASNESIDDIYGPTLKMYEAVCAVYNINGDAPGDWGFNRDFWHTKNAVDKMGSALFKYSGGKIDLNDDGIISDDEINKAIELAKEKEETNKEDKEEKIIKEKETESQAQKAQNAFENKITYKVVSDLNSEIEKMQKENSEIEIDEAIKEYADENGYDYKELKEKFEKEF